MTDIEEPPDYPEVPLGAYVEDGIDGQGQPRVIPAETAIVSVTAKDPKHAAFAPLMEEIAAHDLQAEMPGTLVLTAKQAETLRQTIPHEDIDIKPTGELFASQIRYRRILNDAFGPGAWGLRPVGAPMRETKPSEHVAQEWALYVHGRFVAQAWGEQDFVMGSHQLTYATALEGCKSTALVRCCKDLGVASELWDRHFTEEWKRKNCEQCRDDRGRMMWRRKDSPSSAPEAPRTPPAPQPRPTPPKQAVVPPSASGEPLFVQSVNDRPYTKKDGGQTTLFDITFSDGQKFTTTSRLGNYARKCMEEGSIVTLTTSRNAFGQNLERITVSK
jgi:Mitochondrial genome maintenance MGM101